MSQLTVEFITIKHQVDFQNHVEMFYGTMLQQRATRCLAYRFPFLRILGSSTLEVLECDKPNQIVFRCFFKVQLLFIYIILSSSMYSYRLSHLINNHKLEDQQRKLLKPNYNLRELSGQANYMTLEPLYLRIPYLSFYKA